MIEPLQSDDTLLADIAAVPRVADRLDVWWLGQSGYLVQHADARVVFDPYLSDSLTRKYAGTDKPHQRVSRRVIDPGRLSGVTHVTSTHAHTDHLDADTLNAIFAGNPDSAFLYARATQALVNDRLTSRPGLYAALSSGVRYVYGLAPDGLAFDAVAAAHQPAGRDANGDDNCIGLVAKLGPFTVYHAGDGVVYAGQADAVRALGPIDVAVLPINGKVGNMDGADAARLAKAIGAKLVVPCHYDLFAFNTADPAERFVPECERIGQPYRVLRLGERLTLTTPTA